MLAADESLSERIAADARALEAQGATATDLGHRLVALLDGGGSSDWFIPATAGEFQVELHRQRGVSTCPWAPEEDESCGSGDGGRGAGVNEFVVRNTENGRALEGMVMTAHLIAEHGFFGGADTRFRIEPLELAALLDG